MRTFAHFGTDDQEHRLLHLAGELPEPAETPEAAALPETVDTPVNTPEAIDAEAASVVDLANVDIDAAATQLNAVDTTGVTEDPNVQDAGSNLWAEMRAMDEQPDTRVPLDAPVDPLGGEKNIPGIPESFDTKENERAKTPVVNDTNEGFGPGYPEFAKRQGDLPNGGVKADSGNEGFGPGYPEFAKRQGENRASKEAAQAAVASIGETIPMPEQLVAVDGFGDSEVDGIPKEMMDVRSTLEDRVLNRFAKSFPGVLIDTYDMPNEYVINGKDPAVMEKIRQQAEVHGLSPKDNGDGTMTVTITGFEKGVGYTGPGNSPKEATQPSEVSLEESSARDIENSKKENPDVDMKDLLKPVQRDSLIGGKPYKRPVTKEDLDKAIKKDEEKNDVSKKIENPQRNPSLEIAADPNSNEGAPESKEVLTENYEREKIEQRESREDEKLSDVSSGNRDQWSTIDNGKTDGTGKPFLYKEGTRTIDGQEQRVLLAYSPNGGVQVMDINTHEWKFMNQMTPDEQKQIGGAEGMNAEARDAALAAEQKEDPDAFRKRMDQNGRNLTMEEDCLKDSKANSEWFKSQVRGEGMWKGNEDVYDALAASLATPAVETPPAALTNNPADAANTPPEATDTPADATEKKEEDPEISDLKKQIAELKKAIDALTARLDKVEGKTPEEPKEAEKDGEKDAEKDTQKDEAVAEAEKILKSPDSTDAERAEAVKTITDAALDTLDTEKEDTTETKGPEAEKPSEVKDVDDAKETNETDKDLRSRLIAEVRNPEPMKTVEGLKTEKTEAFDTLKTESDTAIDSAETAVENQDKKIDGIKGKIRNLEQEKAAAKPEKKGEFDTKIAEAKAEQTTGEQDLQKMEDNRATLLKNLETAKDKMDTDVKMLDTLKADWEKSAERTDKKFDEMGATIIDLGDAEMGKLVQGITVTHDGSLGLEMSLGDALIAKIIELLPDTKAEFLKEADNPAPVLQRIAGYIKTLEAQADQKADKKKKT